MPQRAMPDPASCCFLGAAMLPMVTTRDGVHEGGVGSTSSTKRHKRRRSKTSCVVRVTDADAVPMCSRDCIVKGRVRSCGCVSDRPTSKTLGFGDLRHRLCCVFSS